MQRPSHTMSPSPVLSQSPVYGMSPSMSPAGGGHMSPGHAAMMPGMRPPGGMLSADQMRLQQHQQQQQHQLQQQQMLQQQNAGMRFMRPQGGQSMMRPPHLQQMGPQGGPVHRSDWEHKGRQIPITYDTEQICFFSS